MASIRSLLETLFADVRVTRRLPADCGGGQLFATPHTGGLRYLLKPMSKVDPRLLACAKQFVKPNDTVFDIGTNVGLFSVAASFFAGKAGRVFSFEADPHVLALLHKTCSSLSTNYAVVKVIACAVADRVGLGEFCFAARSSSSNHLLGYGQSQTGGTSHSSFVPLLNIDWLSQNLAVPNVVKIDVEGAEKLVLDGGRDLIASARPVVIVEASADNAEFIKEFFDELDYRCFDADDIQFSEVLTTVSPWNAVFIPRARVGVYLPVGQQ